MNRFYFLFPLILTVVFFWQFLFRGLIPIPADTIVGLYNPYRDFYSNKYPRGVPFKNFLITDPVRQQYPWKNLAVNFERIGSLPLWNPYSFSGTPLLGNMQSGAFYPLNILFFIFPFSFAWGFFIFLQTFLMSSFMFLFLRNLKLGVTGSLLGAIVFSLCGYSISWLEWGNILHTALWLPLILLSIDKIFSVKKYIKWAGVFIISLIFSFFAGHLQIFSYVFGVSFLYLIFRWLQNKDNTKIALFLFLIFSFFLLTFFQWGPALRFIIESGRSIDQSNWQKLGWFVPWQNLVQFFAPDFFGNPATLNYRGIFNYGEFVGYIGIVPLILAVFSLFYKKNINILFFGIIFFLSLIFSFPTIFAKIPFILKLPLISTAQPTRLIFVADFCLSILAAYGMDNLYKDKKNIFKVIFGVSVIFIFLWAYVLKFHTGGESSQDLNVSKSNLVFPTLVFIISSLVFVINYFKKTKWIYFVLIAIVLTDLFRFGWKFTPFTPKEYLYPNTQSLLFIKNQKGLFRIMSTDPKIFPPNFGAMYGIESIEGYDPLYIKRYGEFIAAMERGKPDINPPLGFDRIITPHNFESGLVDLLNVKYVLSLSDLSSKKLTKVYEEGSTRIYENKDVVDRAFFVEKTISAISESDSINKLFENKTNLKNVAVVEGLRSTSYKVGDVEMVNHSQNRVVIKTKNEGNGFLVLTDNYYPTWKARVDGKDTKIYMTDFSFRGIEVPKGSHTIEFNISLL